MNTQKNPNQAVADQIVESWAKGKPLLETTGKPSGYYRLTNYLRDYIATHNTLPIRHPHHARRPRQQQQHRTLIPGKLRHNSLTSN